MVLSGVKKIIKAMMRHETFSPGTPTTSSGHLKRLPFRGTFGFSGQQSGPGAARGMILSFFEVESHEQQKGSGQIHER